MTPIATLWLLAAAAPYAPATLDDALRVLSVPAWLWCIWRLLPAVGRMLGRRGRRLDPIWAIVFLLAINRLSFLLRVSAEFSHGSAMILALVMAQFAHWYQRHDG